MKSQKVWLSLCLIFSIVLVACANHITVTPAADTTPMKQTPISPPKPTATEQFLPAFDNKLGDTQCPLTLPEGAVEGENIACYTITMPELHAHSNAESITLTVAIVKSVEQPPQPDPLFMLAGGPGSSALKTFIPILFSPLVSPAGAGYRTIRDVIIVEQRSTLYSSPYLFCDEIAEMNLDLMGQNLGSDERKRILDENLKTCYTRLSDEGINLSAYNSLENAADIAVVARTLGYESINLYGGSYGTMLAQHLMRDHPQLIRSVILDSTAPLRHDPNILNKAVSFDRSLRLLFDQCAADPACAKVYPDLETRFFETVTKLNSSPVTIEVTNPQTGEVHPLLLTGDKLVEITRGYLYLTPLLPSLPKMIVDIADGQYGELGILQSILTFDQSIADGMYKSVVCSELVDFTVEDFADSSELYPDLSRVMNDMLAELWVNTCKIWEVDKLDDIVKTSVTSNSPTLLLSGEFDPTTPPSLADIASEEMSKAYRVTFPGISHGVLGTSDCATDIMLKFFDNPAITPDTNCIKDIHTLEFDLPEEQAATVTLTPVTIESKGIKTAAPEDWSELNPGLFARGKSALDQTLMIFDAVPDQEPSVFIPGLKSFLNLGEFPDESASTFESNAITWNLYRIESTANGMAIHPAAALGQDELNAYVVVLMVSPEESDWLYESAFLPAVEALKPLE